MKYTYYLLATLMSLTLSSTIKADDLNSSELGLEYFDANWKLLEGNGQAYQTQTRLTDNLLADISVKYLNQNWNLVDTDCSSCIELVADLDGYKLILIRENPDD